VRLDGLYSSSRLFSLIRPFSLDCLLVDEDFPLVEKIILVMDNLNTHSIASLYETFSAEEAAAWNRRRDKEAAKINWRFITADARVKLKRLYPQFE
jgi:hypothetical protein